MLFLTFTQCNAACSLARTLYPSQRLCCTRSSFLFPPPFFIPIGKVNRYSDRAPSGFYETPPPFPQRPFFLFAACASFLSSPKNMSPTRTSAPDNYIVPLSPPKLLFEKSQLLPMYRRALRAAHVLPPSGFPTILRSVFITYSLRSDPRVAGLLMVSCCLNIRWTPRNPNPFPFLLLFIFPISHFFFLR